MVGMSGVMKWKVILNYETLTTQNLHSSLYNLRRNLRLPKGLGQGFILDRGKHYCFRNYFNEMKLFLFFFLLTVNAYAGEYSNSEIANAIYKTENSKRYPYGVVSINTKGNEAYARRICLNSISNNRKRWVKAGRPEDFIIFMGRRYCPPKVHSLNSNWVRNVKHFLER